MRLEVELLGRCLTVTLGRTERGEPGTSDPGTTAAQVEVAQSPYYDDKAVTCGFHPTRTDAATAANGSPSGS